MAGVDVRIAEAEAALVTLDEAIGKSTRSLLERDGAILRLIYTFEAVWKASQQFLAEHEGITVASPNATIRAARRVGWLSDEDARAEPLVLAFSDMPRRVVVFELPEMAGERDLLLVRKVLVAKDQHGILVHARLDGIGLV